MNASCREWSKVHELHALDQWLMSLDGEREEPRAIDRLIDPGFFHHAANTRAQVDLINQTLGKCQSVIVFYLIHWSQLKTLWLSFQQSCSACIGPRLSGFNTLRAPWFIIDSAVTPEMSAELEGRGWAKLFVCLTVNHFHTGIRYCYTQRTTELQVCAQDRTKLFMH